MLDFFCFANRLWLWLADSLSFCRECFPCDEGNQARVIPLNHCVVAPPAHRPHPHPRTSPGFTPSTHTSCTFWSTMHTWRCSPTSRLWSFSLCWSTKMRGRPTRRKGVWRGAQRRRPRPRPRRQRLPQHRQGESLSRPGPRRRKWSPRPCDNAIRL